jgi:hypothetical protein
MSIKADVEELKRIDMEVKRLLFNLRTLRSSKREIENRVKTYLKEKELPGVKHQGFVIRLDQKEKKINKPKDERDQAILQLLAHSGVPNPREMLSQINNVSKESKSQDKLKMKKMD